MIEKIFPLRRVRSFVRRDGRMTDGQKDALVKVWPKFQLSLEDGLIDPPTPTVLEIGFGSGYSLVEMAKGHPTTHFIGIETYRPGIGSLMMEVEREQLNNVRVYYADAVEVLENGLPLESLDVVQIFFPDPWPKRRHHKRRLIQPRFVELVVSRLKVGGTLHLATDWEHYAEEMMKVLSVANGLQNLAGVGEFSNRSTQRPVVTKFEKRGQVSGRPIRELQFKKTSPPLSNMGGERV